MRQTEAQTNSLIRFCSSYEQKFVICLCAEKETNGSYPFANVLNGLAHIC